MTYLTKKIIATKRTTTPSWGMCQSGYTKRSGAPTSLLIQLEGEKIWRRLMVLQFSNAGSCFIKVKGVVQYVHDFDLSTF